MTSEMMKDTIQRYVEESFLIEFGEQITGETDLFEAQIIDSFGFVELVAHLESTFGVKITDEDLLSSRLATLNGIVALMQERVLASSHA